MSAAIALGAGGCGGGDSSTGSSTAPTASSRASRGAPVSAGNEAKLSEAEERSANAVGRSACRGLAPTEAAKRFAAAARDAGAERFFVAAVADPTPAIESSPGYPRLVASLYAITVPERERRAAAAAGCAHELAASVRGDESPPDRAGQSGPSDSPAAKGRKAANK